MNPRVTPRKSAFTSSPRTVNRQRSAAKVTIRNKNGASTADARHICAIMRMISSDWTPDWTVDLGRLNLASNASTDIKGKGKSLSENGREIEPDTVERHIARSGTLSVSLMSVAKIIDLGFKVMFDNQKAEIIDSNNKRKVITKREKDYISCAEKPAKIQIESKPRIRL